MKSLLAFLAAFIFGLGLAISGMTNPAAIQGFLDISNEWQPALILVMGGAIRVHIITYHFITKKKSPILAPSFVIPSFKNIDKKLIIGSLTFGAGWGLSGFCPGPAIAALGYGYSDVFIFVGAMLVGAKAQQWLTPKHSK